jgi:hypothetical protein
VFFDFKVPQLKFVPFVAVFFFHFNVFAEIAFVLGNIDLDVAARFEVQQFSLRASLPQIL